MLKSVHLMQQTFTDEASTNEAVEVLLVAVGLLNPVSAFGSPLQLSNTY